MKELTDGEREICNQMQRDALDDEVPQSLCPKCRQWQDDFDGFGVLKCVHCDYCSHASITDGVCGLCGANRT